jgi:hypothetical protein
VFALIKQGRQEILQLASAEVAKIRSAATPPFGATDCGVDGTYALRSAVAGRSSPEAAQRCAEGAGLDGAAYGRSTISRAVKHGQFLARSQAAIAA